MLQLSALIVLPCALFSAETLSYEAAAKEAEAKRQPLLVLVGADWCPGCQTMKRSILPAVARRGGLGKVSYAVIDTDREPQLAGRLMRGTAIPQLIAFTRQANGEWRREQIVGATSEQQVQSLISRARDAQGTPNGESASAIGD
jgi:thioredoxin-like negative regulator of GroEL